jgi:hypothetical protein
MKVDMFRISSKIIEFFRLAHYSMVFLLCQYFFEKIFDYFDLDTKMLANALKIALNWGHIAAAITFFEGAKMNEIC